MSAHGSPVKARRRGDVWFALRWILALAALAWMAITVQALAHDLRTANDARDALAQQVQTLGGKPVAGPPGSRGEAGEPGKSVVGPTGPPGPSGAAGEPGQDAPTPSPGASGASGAPGKPGASVTGPAGASGQPGAAGAAGPVGPQGEPGPAGPAGQDGADGRDGTDGQNGTDGKPPAGWTFTYLGATYTCRPVDDFDPDSPRYDCQPGTPGNSDNGDSQPQAAGLDPTRRQYV